VEIGDGAILLLRMAGGAFQAPFRWKNLLTQMVNIGVDTLPIASIMAIFTGMVLAVQTYSKLKVFEAETLVGSVVGASMTMELGPVLTAIIVAGRCGSSTAAELGTMKVSEQIDALEAMAVDPVKYLATPRLLASLIMLPILTVFTDFIGIFGGYLVSVGKLGIKSSIYIDSTIDWVDPQDIWSGLIKAFFFGGIIAVVSCQRGFKAYGGAEGVGRVTTQAVVLSSILILISNYFLTEVLI
jgi:phospholipid/cholesterol/gamma-HCH transport system permease protein